MKKEERSRDTLDSILNDFLDMIERKYSKGRKGNGIREID
jgi:hypothetical protein